MATEELTDDYVANLLAKDAKESSIRYSAMGLQGFGPSKPPANKPKPNTRFLRNIIKDTDNHNAALLAKEAAEARARLRTLSSHQEETKKPVRVGAGDIRRRQLGDIAAILGGRPSKRRRTEDEDDKKGDGSRYANTSSEEDKPKEKSQDKSREKTRDRESRKERDDKRSSRDHRNRNRRDRSISEERGKEKKARRHRDRSRSRSPMEHRDRDPKRRERSRRRKRSSSPDDRTHRHSTKSRRNTEKEPIRAEEKPNPKPDYDSDPLDSIIGPRPPEIKIRGRGTASHASGIDARFSVNYDPTTDVALDPDEENDWDQALEALKDRQKWKQQGADRLRAAGFTEEEVKKWESGGEKREADVRWAKKGEGREWDRGKVLGEDGVVTVESSFGRLTSM